MLECSSSTLLEFSIPSLHPFLNFSICWISQNLFYLQCRTLTNSNTATLCQILCSIIIVYTLSWTSRPKWRPGSNSLTLMSCCQRCLQLPQNHFMKQLTDLWYNCREQNIVYVTYSFAFTRAKIPKAFQITITPLQSNLSEVNGVYPTEEARLQSFRCLAIAIKYIRSC